MRNTIVTVLSLALAVSLFARATTAPPIAMPSARDIDKIFNAYIAADCVTKEWTQVGSNICLHPETVEQILRNSEK